MSSGTSGPAPAVGGALAHATGAASPAAPAAGPAAAPADPASVAISTPASSAASPAPAPASSSGCGVGPTPLWSSSPSSGSAAAAAAAGVSAGGNGGGGAGGGGSGGGGGGASAPPSSSSSSSSAAQPSYQSTTRRKRKAHHGGGSDGIKNVSRLTTSLLRTQLKALADGAVDGVEVWLPDDDLLHWGLTVEGPPDTLYEGALFRAELTFPVSYPDQPPEMRFTGVVPYHPNVYADGRVCISILHAPGENATGELGAPTDEPDSEKWRPVLGVDSIVVSVMSMLSDPNCSSPANVEAGVLWREDRSQFKKKVLKCVAASIEQ